MAKSRGVKWTREHTLIALNLYCKLPYNSFVVSNPIVQTVATRMGRSADSLAMKLCNFVSFDPVQRARGVVGLKRASKQDGIIWREFHSDPSISGPASEQLLHDLFTDDDAREVDFLQGDEVRLEPSSELGFTSGSTESTAIVKARRGQQFFRQSILNVYGIRCCISDINVPRLLVASHIKPWHEFPSDRLNPRNGLCLSSIHDAAFDSGLITLDEEFRVVLSKRLRSFFPQPTLEQNFVPFAGKPIRLPEKLAEPHADFLTYHRESVFEN